LFREVNGGHAVGGGVLVGCIGNLVGYAVTKMGNLVGSLTGAENLLRVVGNLVGDALGNSRAAGVV
jgi:hypothetical protein